MNNLDEDELIAKFKNGDKTTFEKILTENIDLITRIAKKYKRFFTTVTIDELISEGTYGLFQAVKHYNKSKKVEFAAYAQFWIKKYIKEYIIKNHTLIHITCYFLKNIKKVFNLIDKDIHISLEEVSAKINLDIDKAKELILEQIKAKKELSLDRYLDESEQQETLYEIIPDTSTETPEEMLHKEEIKTLLDKFLNKLSYKESEVIKWRFGLKDHKYHPIKEVAKKLNLAPYKVKELEKLALAKLKQFANEITEDIGS